MYVRMVGGEPHPRTWQEYERLIICCTENTNTVIALRPGAWQEYEHHLQRGTTDLSEEFEEAESLEDLRRYRESETSGG